MYSWAGVKKSYEKFFLQYEFVDNISVIYDSPGRLLFHLLVNYNYLAYKLSGEINNIIDQLRNEHIPISTVFIVKIELDGSIEYFI